MLAAIVKVSSRPSADGASLIGGVAGTLFALKNRTCVTAHHVLNKGIFKPPDGYDAMAVFFVFETGQIVRVLESQIQEFPQQDLSIFKHPRIPVGKWDIDANLHAESEPVSALGYWAGVWPPEMVIDANRSPAIITRANVAKLMIVTTGHVMSRRSVTLNAKDIKIKDVEAYEISTAIFVGMSGGPLLSADNKVIGMLSFGLPADQLFKTDRFAIWSGVWTKLAGL